MRQNTISTLTILHREYTSCSTDELFIESLNELREVYARNSYPKALIESKIKNFMSQISKQTEKHHVNLSHGQSV